MEDGGRTKVENEGWFYKQLNFTFLFYTIANWITSAAGSSETQT